MSDRPSEEDPASRWRREASEELRAAEVVAAHGEVPDRVAGFHAHLAAEKALKSLLIERGIEMPRNSVLDESLAAAGRILDAVSADGG